MEIKNRYTNEVLYSQDGNNLRDANLRGAYLCGADLCGADLGGGLLPLYIQGSRDPVIVVEKDVIRVGCVHKPFSYWKENYQQVGSAHSYTKTQICEYWYWLRLARRYQLTNWSAKEDENEKVGD